MAESFLTCPLCGFEFQRADSLCKHGCPLGAACTLARCPQCEYEFPERLPGTSWLRRLFRKEDGTAPPAPAESLLTVNKPHLPAWLNDVELRNLRVGDSRISLVFRREGDITSFSLLAREGGVRVVMEE